MNRRQLEAQQNLLAVILQALAIRLALHFSGVVQRALHRTEAHNQILRALIPNSRRARNIVHSIALQGEKIGHLRRLDAHELLRLRGVVDHVVFHRIQHAGVVVHQLQHVLVARNNHHVHAAAFRPPRQGTDDIVRLEAGVFQHRNTHGIERFANPRNLRKQIRRRLRAIGFVRLEGLIAKSGPFALENRREIFRLVLRLQLAQHVMENVDRLVATLAAVRIGGAPDCARA